MMNKISNILICIIILVVMTGCSNKTKEKTPITVNLPKDNTLNGYKDDTLPKKSNQYSANIDSNKITIIEKEESYSYFGNKTSKKFHKASCKTYKNTNKENIILYKSREDFIKYEYSPCKTCNP